MRRTATFAGDPRRRPIVLAATLLAWAAHGAAAEPTERQKIVHLLQRAAFGPTRAELARIETIGREAWIDEQLQPPPQDDPATLARLERYPVLAMPLSQLLSLYPPQCEDRSCSRFNIPEQLVAATMIRAVHSRYQLREVMVDFWLNHFNVFGFEGPTPYALKPYLEEVIRPHALGRFEDLLLAVARSSAMLYYLDNYLSTREGAPLGQGRSGGLNENYARELMELHTISLFGGYSQQDVIEVAKLLTGWTFNSDRDPASALTFVFRTDWHEPGPKTVLGRTFDAGGLQEGLDLLRFLAAHPSTADNMIAPKLVSRLVADTPPNKLLKATARAFKNSGGDIAATLSTLLRHRDFYKADYMGAKIKAPLELVASSARALEAEVTDGLPLARAVRLLGQPLFGALPPTGWPDVGSEIASAGGMLTRFRFAELLAAGDLPGLRIDLAALAPAGAGNQLADQLIDAIVQGQVADDTRQGLRQAARSGSATRALVAGLVLGCPEFQAQ
jgi:uncharacterized protein (DUF1800 family)